MKWTKWGKISRKKNLIKKGKQRIYEMNERKIYWESNVRISWVLNVYVSCAVLEIQKSIGKSAKSVLLSKVHVINAILFRTKTNKRRVTDLESEQAREKMMERWTEHWERERLTSWKWYDGVGVCWTHASCSYHWRLHWLWGYTAFYGWKQEQCG